ncbi:hypothetical protein V3N95_11935 (plasmid) [Micrococcaceae bacterium Sec6.3]
MKFSLTDQTTPTQPSPPDALNDAAGTLARLWDALTQEISAHALIEHIQDDSPDLYESLQVLSVAAERAEAADMA